MPKTKVAITLEASLLRQVDALVRQRHFVNRSHAIEAAVEAQLARIRRTRLAEACSHLDPAAERALAEEGLHLDVADWPEY